MPCPKSHNGGVIELEHSLSWGGGVRSKTLLFLQHPLTLQDGEGVRISSLGPWLQLGGH